MSLLDLFRSRPATDRPAGQPGNPPAGAEGYANPVVVGEHMSPAIPKAMAEVEWTGTDYDTVATRPAPPYGGRAWRLGAATSSTTAAPGSDAPSFDASPAASADGDHLEAGAPDARRGEFLTVTRPELAGQAEHARNVRTGVYMDEEPPPARARQGFTGADNTRAATVQVATFSRLFDQAIAQHPASVPKAGQPAPRAAIPRIPPPLAGGHPNAGGTSGGQGMQPVGPSPNTVRIPPTPWDTRIVNPGVQAASNSAVSRWRL